MRKAILIAVLLALTVVFVAPLAVYAFGNLGQVESNEDERTVAVAYGYLCGGGGRSFVRWLFQ